MASKNKSKLWTHGFSPWEFCAASFLRAVTFYLLWDVFRGVFPWYFSFPPLTITIILLDLICCDSTYSTHDPILFSFLFPFSWIAHPYVPAFIHLMRNKVFYGDKFNPWLKIVAVFTVGAWAAYSALHSLQYDHWTQNSRLNCRIPSHKMANLKHCYHSAAVVL